MVTTDLYALLFFLLEFGRGESGESDAAFRLSV